LNPYIWRSYFFLGKYQLHPTYIYNFVKILRLTFKNHAPQKIIYGFNQVQTIGRSITNKCLWSTKAPAQRQSIFNKKSTMSDHAFRICLHFLWSSLLTMCFCFWKSGLTLSIWHLLSVENWVSYGICVIVHTLCSARMFENQVFRQGTDEAWKLCMTVFSILCAYLSWSL